MKRKSKKPDAVEAAVDGSREVVASRSVGEFAAAMAARETARQYAAGLVVKLRDPTDRSTERDEVATAIERLLQILHEDDREIQRRGALINAAGERFIAAVDVLALAAEAARKHGGEKNNGLFRVEDLQGILAGMVPFPDMAGRQHVIRLLEKERRIVRLSGDHWLLLPNGYVRYYPSDPVPATT